VIHAWPSSHYLLLLFYQDLLTYFAERNLPFMMECCSRTEADKKGGHLALRTADNQLILRESAQCSKSDEGFFQVNHSPSASET
jgi:UDP-N-acetylglucosamine pyrophosphorylase